MRNIYNVTVFANRLDTSVNFSHLESFCCEICNCKISFIFSVIFAQQNSFVRIPVPIALQSDSDIRIYEMRLYKFTLREDQITRPSKYVTATQSKLNRCICRTKSIEIAIIIDAITLDCLLHVYQLCRGTYAERS